MTDRLVPPSVASTAPVVAEGLHGPIRLKWHKLRTRWDEAPFKPSNLALGWQAGASLEIDILASADHRIIVAHDTTLGPSTTGHGRIARLPIAAMENLFHRDRAGSPDLDAPLQTLADFLAPLHALERRPQGHLQLDLKLSQGRMPSEASIADAAAAVAGLEDGIVVSSYYLEPARRFVSAMPSARLGYDPLRAASRDPGLARCPERLLRHLERHQKEVWIVYLRYEMFLAAETQGFPLVRRLLDLGIATDAWTVNPGPELTDSVLRRLVGTGVSQITTDSPIEIAQRIAGL